MSFIDTVKETVRKRVQEEPLRLILSEASDPRVLLAGIETLGQGLATEVHLVGETKKIQDTAASLNLAPGADLNTIGLFIHDPAQSERLDEFAALLHEIAPKEYGSPAEARHDAALPLYYASILHRLGVADIHVAGAVETSAAVIRAYFRILKTNRKEGIATSYFLLESPGVELGQNGVLLLADCAVNVNPSPKMLARIAYQTGNIAKEVFSIDTNLALLSYSTKGSGSGEPVEATLEAAAELEKLQPDFTWEGEMQADAAIVPEVSDRKAPGNSLVGKANVLIFPDLQSGNIAYKLIERFGKARAYGPVMVGLGKTASDLSRGCSMEDIVGTYAVAAFHHLAKMAQNPEN